MKVIRYPDHNATSGDSGSIGKFFKNLKKKRPGLWFMVYRTIEEVEAASNLKSFERQDWVDRLSSSKYPLYEFKIPPKTRGGVVRLYFAYKKNKPNTIIILSAELKKKKKADPEKIKQAEQRYQEVCL